MSDTDFGLIPLGSSSPARSFTISNPLPPYNADDSSAPQVSNSLVLGPISLAGTDSSDYSVGGTCSSGGTLAGGDSCTVTAAFTPTAAGSRSATLTIPVFPAADSRMPVVTTQIATSITTTTATANGTVVSLGGATALTAYGVCWKLDGTPTINDNVVKVGTTAAAGTTFTASLTGLTDNKSYFVRSYATSKYGTSYGNLALIHTGISTDTKTGSTLIGFNQADMAVVATQAATGITATTATANGFLISVSAAGVTDYGLCRSATSIPTTSDTCVSNGAASSLGAFTASFTGLTAATTYYIRAYAVNSYGTSYGRAVKLTTANASGSTSGSSSVLSSGVTVPYNIMTVSLTGTGIISTDSIVIDPVTSTTLYAGLNGAGVYKSVNSGTTWTAATTQPSDTRIKALVINKSDTTKLYVATYGGGVYKSVDSGVTWAACATNPTNLNVVSLVIDGNGKLYAGTEAGVFVSADACATWTAMNTGLPE
jgi:hypothetical protein